MLEINCPYCGPRAETEFSCGGEGGIVRPLAPDQLDDRAWGEYLFMRDNELGVVHEQWRHASGCGRWFNAWRDTRTHRFRGVWKIGETAPPADADGRTA